MKFDRKYKLSVEVEGGRNVEIELPFTCEFQVNRQSLASANTGTFVIRNLGQRTRDLIYLDKYDWTTPRAVQFRAGYGTFTPLILNGTVKQAFSYREGVDMVTVIEAWDGGFQHVNGFSSMTVAPGQSANYILNKLCADLPQIKGAPIIGDFPVTNARGEVLFGNTWQIIQQKSNGLATIDNSQVKILNNNECIEGEIPLINSDSGLLGSPRRSDAQLEFEMLFEPRFTIGQIVQLQSSTNKLFDGTYKVMGFNHKGVISPVVSGQASTSVSLWLGTELLKVIKGDVVQ